MACHAQYCTESYAPPEGRSGPTSEASSLDGDNEDAFAMSYLDAFDVFVAAEGLAESEMEYGVADLEIGYNVGIGDNGGNVRLFFGARYARFDQDTNFAGVSYNSFYSVSAAFAADREVEFEGIGPRIGVGLNLPLGNRISIAAEVSGSVLFGDKETTDRFGDVVLNAANGAYLGYHYAEANEDDDQIVPNAEANIGLSFVVAGSNPGPVAEITLGYHAEAWFDINNTDWDVIGQPGALGLGTFSGGGVAEEDGDQYIHGPFVRIGIRR